ncbi:MAG: flippase-like domain-containing protein [Anaerolineae bacterium]|nr:flippase-like domain-containing protein [Anaerolineae bacterium]
MGKRWQFWLGLLVSLFFMWLVLRKMELPRVWAELRTAQYLWIIPGVLVYFCGVWARTWRWHYLLRPLRPVPLPRLFPVVCIGYMGNNILPARAGELIRGYVLKRREHISFSASFATIIIERVFDGLVMLLFVFVALPFTPLPSVLRIIVIVSSLLFGGALLVFFVIAASPERARAVYDFIGRRFLPEALLKRTQALFDRFLTGLHSLRSVRNVLMIFATSVIIWLAETVKYWFVMHAFTFTVPFYVLMLMNGVVNLATTVPSSPGYVGTFDWPGIVILNSFGVAKEVATAYTLVLHAALWFPITALGAFYMMRQHFSLRELGSAQRSEVAEAAG